jgi:hypothetical protein
VICSRTHLNSFSPQLHVGGFLICLAPPPLWWGYIAPYDGWFFGVPCPRLRGHDCIFATIPYSCPLRQWRIVRIYPNSLSLNFTTFRNVGWADFLPILLFLARRFTAGSLPCVILSETKWSRKIWPRIRCRSHTARVIPAKLVPDLIGERESSDPLFAFCFALLIFASAIFLMDRFLFPIHCTLYAVRYTLSPACPFSPCTPAPLTRRSSAVSRQVSLYIRQSNIPLDAHVYYFIIAFDWTF